MILIISLKWSGVAAKKDAESRATKLPADELTAADAADVFDVNVIGVVRVTPAFLPLLRASANPVIVNVSSGMGSFAVTHDPDRRPC